MPASINFSKPNDIQLNINESHSNQLHDDTSEILLASSIRRVSHLLPQPNTNANINRAKNFVIAALATTSTILGASLYFIAKRNDPNATGLQIGNSNNTNCIPADGNDSSAIHSNPYNNSRSEGLFQPEPHNPQPRGYLKDFSIQEAEKYEKTTSKGTQQGNWELSKQPDVIPSIEDVRIMFLKNKSGKMRIDSTPFNTQLSQLTSELYSLYYQSAETCLNFERANTTAQQLDAVVDAYLTRFNLPSANMELLGDELYEKISDCQTHVMELINNCRRQFGDSADSLKNMSKEDKESLKQLKSIYKSLAKTRDRIPKEYHTDQFCTQRANIPNKDGSPQKVEDVKIDIVKDSNGTTAYVNTNAFSEISFPLEEALDASATGCLDTQYVSSKVQELDVTLQAYLRHDLPQITLSDFANHLYLIKEDISMNMMKIRESSLKKPFNFNKDVPLRAKASYSDLNNAHKQVTESLNRIPKQYHPEYCRK